MKYRLFFLLVVLLFFSGCASNLREGSNSGTETFTVKVINASVEKVLIRYQTEDLGYTFRFVDPENDVKFTMNGNLVIQYTVQDADDAKYLSIKQDTLIHVKNNEILIDDLPKEEKILENKVSN